VRKCKCVCVWLVCVYVWLVHVSDNILDRHRERERVHKFVQSKFISTHTNPTIPKITIMILTVFCLNCLKQTVVTRVKKKYTSTHAHAYASRPPRQTRHTIQCYFKNKLTVITEK